MRIRRCRSALAGALLFLLAACDSGSSDAKPQDSASADSDTSDSANADTDAALDSLSPDVDASDSDASDSNSSDTGSGDAALRGTVVIWTAYGSGGTGEFVAFSQLLEAYRASRPDVEVVTIDVPFSDIFQKWATDVAAGGGPDLFVAPNDSLGPFSRDGLLRAVGDRAGQLEQVLPVAVEGMTVGGQLYGVPLNVKAVALFYDKEAVPDPPTSTEELAQLVQAGQVLTLNQNPYHLFGFFAAFGGTLADAGGKCIADQGGFAEAMQYLLELKTAGAVFSDDAGLVAQDFMNGQATMTIDGPWRLADYQDALGARLGVVALPTGPEGPARPLTGVDGLYFNPNTENLDVAFDLALQLASAAGQKVYADVAGNPPARTDVSVDDPLVQAFADAAAAGIPRPQEDWLNNYWGPFGDMIMQVLDEGVPPAEAVDAACQSMNEANGL